MEFVRPEFYDMFKCVGGPCEDSCCIGWEVEVDDDTYDYYNSVGGSFGGRLRKNMNIGEEKSFVIKKNGRCPFLNNKNLCDIYTELGEEHLCSVCTDFPRIYAQIGSYKQVAVSVSCMEAGRLLFSIDAPLSFVIQNNDIVPDEDISEEDKRKFGFLRRTRRIAISIMQCRYIGDRYVTWRERAACILDYIDNIQECWNRNDEVSVDGVCSAEGFREYLSMWLGEAHNSEGCDEGEYSLLCTAMLDGLQNLLPINMMWKKEYRSTMKNIRKHFSGELWKQFCACISEHSEVWFEHLMVYFIYKYHILALYDNNILTKIKLAVSSCIMIECMDYSRWLDNGKQFTFEDRVDVAHIYSREVEHSEDNLESLTEEILFDDVYDTCSLKKILLAFS